MFSAHLTKFKFTILAAVALLAVIGAVVALPDSAEAGRKALIIKSVDMTITPTATATRDNKEVAISFTWGAPSRAKGYRVDRRHRVNVADSPVGEAEWSTWEKRRYQSSTERRMTIEETHSFPRAGTQVEWRIKLKDKNDKWGLWRNVSVSWGLKSKHPYHYVIKREWFPCC